MQSAKSFSRTSCPEKVKGQSISCPHCTFEERRVEDSFFHMISQAAACHSTDTHPYICCKNPVSNPSAMQTHADLSWRAAYSN